MNSLRTLTLILACLLTGFTSIQAATHGLGHELSVTDRSPAAPQLRLKTLDGGEIDISALRGRVVVVNFWATWCPPCVEEMPTIQKLWEETHDSGLDVLAVNVGEPVEAIEAFLQDFEPTLDFPILLDLQGEAFQAWEMRGLPKTFVIDRRGRVIYEAEGGRDMNSAHIRERLQRLIDE